MNSTATMNGSPLKSLSQTEIQRKRHDAISSLMGQYLLKGWRMLNESCQTCGTILFRQPNGELYCVACSELDSKSPPAYASDKPVDSESTKRNHVQVEAPASPGDDIEIAPRTKRPDTKLENSYHANEFKYNIHASYSSELIPMIDFQKKISWCSQRLLESVSPGDIRAWAEALKSLIDAVDSLHRCELLGPDLRDKRNPRGKRT